MSETYERVTEQVLEMTDKHGNEYRLWIDGVTSRAGEEIDDPQTREQIATACRASLLDGVAEFVESSVGYGRWGWTTGRRHTGSVMALDERDGIEYEIAYTLECTSAAEAD